jgi:hypothetical protein
MSELERDAAKVVKALLEDDTASGLVRACPKCEQERGIKPAHNATHTPCKRHMIQQYHQILQHFINDPMKVAELRRELAVVRSRPEDSFAPDLSRQTQPTV